MIPLLLQCSSCERPRPFLEGISGWPWMFCLPRANRYYSTLPPHSTSPLLISSNASPITLTVSSKDLILLSLSSLLTSKTISRPPLILVSDTGEAFMYNWAQAGVRLMLSRDCGSGSARAGGGGDGRRVIGVMRVCGRVERRSSLRAQG